jgi:hypothetical protein
MDLYACYDRKYLSKDLFAELYRERTAIRKLTVGFIRSMILPRGGVRTQSPPKSWSSQVWEIYERVTGKPRPDQFAAPKNRSERNDEPPA